LTPGELRQLGYDVIITGEASASWRTPSSKI
jgi:hypothetical protein